MECGARTAGFDHLGAQPLGHDNAVGRGPGVAAVSASHPASQRRPRIGPCGRQATLAQELLVAGGSSASLSLGP